MKQIVLVPFILLFLTGCSENSKMEKRMVDWVLTNGRIYTMNPDQPWADTLVVEGGRIRYVGSSKGAAAFSAPANQTIDLAGKMVLPGFQDVHIHPVSGGAAYAGCALFDDATLDDVLRHIAQCGAENPDAQIIAGRGWNWDHFAGTIGPDKKLLDALDSSRPLIFGDSDGHTQWVNSKALELAGITDLSIDPEGGEISRYPNTREPTGALLESAAGLINALLPPLTDQQRIDALRYAQDYLNSLGITAIQDAYVLLAGEGPNRSLETYRTLRDSGELNLRVSTALSWDPEQDLAQIADMVQARDEYSGGRLQATTVKFWADGILESYTAMMLEPYSNQLDNRGLLMVPREDMLAAAPKLDALGFQLHIHMIGDATVRYGLDAIEAARDANGVRDSRHLTAHTQVVNPEDLRRFAELDVIAGFSPYWAYADGYVANINPAQIGPQRMQQMYPIKSILDTGARIAFGSDWSVSDPNPLLGIEVAVTRIEPEGEPTPVFLPTERINLHHAIAGYTSSAAYANFLDADTGSLEVGKYADLVVLSQNLFDIPADGISDTHVTATLLEGKVVHGVLH